MSFNDDRGVARDGRKTTATRFVFTREERELLVNLVTRHKAVIENKRTDALTKRAKDSAWEKLTSEYNSQPGIRRVTVHSCNPYDSDGAHLNQPVLSLSPSRIFESMLTGSQDNTEELLDETIQPQLRSSKSAGSSGPQTTQPPTEGACASCPSHTLAVVAPGNEESRTAAAAPEDNRENLVGAGERQRPKSTRSRLAAIERVLAPEAAARMEALKTDKQRKAQLHALELRLRKQQLLHQRKMHRMQVQREQELHKMQVQLLKQQLEQQKWRFNIERQKLLFELQEKRQQQRIETQPKQK
ncbi:hypothetical protein HPB51_020606 [Rhipicephalus microplus]|uniref:Regulatory protein zeste n=1 Tax=Rhipicephalus microplus TaxID=6941 RepID=A0A9J6DIE5_RHIMP|nr:hypothetical protein HPB51_020606 [Rhipicephalus microplus]